MRQATMALFLCLLVTPQRKCPIATNGEQVRQMAEDQMRSYFPNAKAINVQRPKMILVLTCTQGVSQGFVVKLMNYMATDAEMQKQLGMINLSQLLGYQYFSIGFDSGWILYDINAKNLETRETTPEYLNAYRQVCSQ